MDFNKNTLKDQEEKETPKSVKIILVVFFSLIVIALASTFYYFASKSSLMNATFQESAGKIVKPIKKVQPPPAFITKVISYSFPIDSNLLTGIKTVSGFCNKASVAQPFRNDAYICTDSVKNYDPCFASIAKDKVVCQMNPLLPDIFIINLTKPLPEITLPSLVKDNFAWFLELEDGTICSPYTSANPIINKVTANYGCKSKVKGDLTVLIGDLIIGQAWTGKVTVVTKDNTGIGWDTKSSEVVRIKTAWQ